MVQATRNPKEARRDAQLYYVTCVERLLDAARAAQEARDRWLEACVISAAGDGERIDEEREGVR